MTPKARWALLVAVLVAFALTVVAAGQRSEPPRATGVERLGPEFGEPVAGYLRRAERSLPAPGGDRVWALVQLSDYLDPLAAADLVGGVRLSVVVFRVPLPGVQTALVTRDLPGQRPGAELMAAMREAAQDRARVAAQAPPGSRRALIAAAEATRLHAGCACVLALLVRADGAPLHELTGRPGVRAVHAASPSAAPQELAVSPLLPEQHDVVSSVPDDAPIPS